MDTNFGETLICAFSLLLVYENYTQYWSSLLRKDNCCPLTPENKTCISIFSFYSLLTFSRDCNSRSFYLKGWFNFQVLPWTCPFLRFSVLVSLIWTSTIQNALKAFWTPTWCLNEMFIRAFWISRLTVLNILQIFQNPKKI